MRFSKIYQKSKKLENRIFFKKTLDKYPRLCYNNDSEREVIKMRIVKNEHDKLYPYTICGGWGDKIYCDEENLKELKKEIEKILDKRN